MSNSDSVYDSLPEGTRDRVFELSRFIIRKFALPKSCIGLSIGSTGVDISLDYPCEIAVALRPESSILRGWSILVDWTDSVLAGPGSLDRQLSRHADYCRRAGMPAPVYTREKLVSEGASIYDAISLVDEIVSLCSGRGGYVMVTHNAAFAIDMLLDSGLLKSIPTDLRLFDVGAVVKLAQFGRDDMQRFISAESSLLLASGVLSVPSRVRWSFKTCSKFVGHAFDGSGSQRSVLPLGKAKTLTHWYVSLCTYAEKRIDEKSGRPHIRMDI